jgi:DNA repair photolyase
MSSITDPYVPQEKSLGLTAELLEKMISRPPDVLVIQTHSTLIGRDLHLIKKLSGLCQVWVSMTVETDLDPVPGFPPHTFPPLQRLGTLKAFKDKGIQTQTTVSPLLPLKNPIGFAQGIGEASHRVILDHFLIGDGSNGKRTLRTDFVKRLNTGGYSEWAKLEKLWEVRNIFQTVLGDKRVLVSQEGFNSV